MMGHGVAVAFRTPGELFRLVNRVVAGDEAGEDAGKEGGAARKPHCLPRATVDPPSPVERGLFLTEDLLPFADLQSVTRLQADD